MLSLDIVLHILSRRSLSYRGARAVVACFVLQNTTY